MTWSEVVQSWILNPETREAHPTREWAFVVVQFHWNPGMASHVDWLIQKHVHQVHLVHLAEQITRPSHIQESHNTCSICVDSPQHALEIALKINQQMGDHVRLSVGFGSGHLQEAFLCSEYLTCHHLMPFVRPHEFVVLDDAYKHCQLPDGVGAFPASNVLQNRTGCSFWILKDYRPGE